MTTDCAFPRKPWFLASLAAENSLIGCSPFPFWICYYWKTQFSNNFHEKFRRFSYDQPCITRPQCSGWGGVDICVQAIAYNSRELPSARAPAYFLLVESTRLGRGRITNFENRTLGVLAGKTISSEFFPVCSGCTDSKKGHEVVTSVLTCVGKRRKA